MLSYRHVATYTGPQSLYVTNIADLHAVALPSGNALYSATHLGGGLASWRLNSADQPIAIQSMQPYGSWARYLDSPEIGLVELSSVTAAFSVGLRGAVAHGFRVSGDGQLAGSQGLSGGMAGDIIHLGGFETSTGSFLYAVRNGRTAIETWRVQGDGPVGLVGYSQLPLGPAIQGTEIDDLQVVSVADRSFMVSVSGLGNYIAVQQINPGGNFGRAEILGADRGLGLNGPAHVESVNVAGITYLVVASSQSSSLTTLRLGYNGSLTPVDHVIDELGTRFQRATALDAVTVDGRSFIFVGGGDDGITVFTIRQDGHLIHLATLADTAGYAMDNVSAISTLEIDGKIAVFVSSRAEKGITQFAFDPGAIGETVTTSSDRHTGTGNADMLQAGAGTTWLFGSAGNDILIAGDNPVNMTGGAGADTFVAKPVTGKIAIMDFEPGIDRLDLSDLGMIRSTLQLTFRGLSSGIRIVFGETTIDIRTIDGTRLSSGYFDNSLFPIAHYDPPKARTTVLGTAGNDTLTAARFGSDMLGYGGQDLMIGSYGDEMIRGGAGSDTITGVAGDDRILGEPGDDILRGGEGADDLIGGTGNDQLFGGADNDTLRAQDGNDSIYGEGGHDLIVDTVGNNLILGGSGNDQIISGSGHDMLDGGHGNDTILGGAGNDRLAGGAGDDRLRGDDGNDRLLAGDGNDTAFGGAGNDVITGDAGHDQILGDGGNDWISGGPGNDGITGGPGHDTIRAGADHDVLIGADGDDFLYGEDGHDTLIGGAGNDRLDGGSGNDQLVGESGNDQIVGGAGNDTMLGRSGDDTLNTGTGNDYARGEDGDDILIGGTGNDSLFGDGGHDRLYGNGGADLIDGGAGNDTIHSGSGSSRLPASMHNTLSGGSGNDVIIGGHDNDWITGGSGRDQMIGGGGADLFIFRDARDFDGSLDIIRDFTRGVDHIDLRGLNLTLIDDSPFSGGRQIRQVTHATLGTVVEIDLTGDGGADLRLALGDVGTLGAGDFLL